MSILLAVENLTVQYQNGVKALDNISFDVNEGEVLGIIGESGSGKSTFAYAAMGLLPGDAEKQGSIGFEGNNIFSLTNKELTAMRGLKISLIMQDAAASFNPVLTIGFHFREILYEKLNIRDRKTQDDIIAGYFKKVKLTEAERIAASYPHQLSGGQLQRAAIAFALALKPKILIADEPTSSLDVTVESQIINLLKELKKDYGFTVIFITHNLNIARYLCDRAIVLYGGRIREINTLDKLFADPKDNYTKSLLEALKVIGG